MERVRLLSPCSGGSWWGRLLPLPPRPGILHDVARPPADPVRAWRDDGFQPRFLLPFASPSSMYGRLGRPPCG